MDKICPEYIQDTPLLKPPVNETHYFSTSPRLSRRSDDGVPNPDGPPQSSGPSVVVMSGNITPAGNLPTTTIFNRSCPGGTAQDAEVPRREERPIDETTEKHDTGWDGTWFTIRTSPLAQGMLVLAAAVLLYMVARRYKSPTPDFQGLPRYALQVYCIFVHQITRMPPFL